MDRPQQRGDAVGMSGIVDRHPPRARGDRRAGRTPATALFWRLFLLNALVFVAGAGVLVLSPATVSAQVAIREVAVLTVGRS
jgi:two-component system, NarL family, sensor histidine kinase UhpB